MYKGGRPRIIPILILIIIVALVIAGLVSLARLLISGGSTSTSQTATESQQIRSDVLDTSNGRAVRFTERGSIVADENFKTYQIYITPTSRIYTTYKGYLDQVVNTTSYSNSTQAYEQFVYALDKANINSVRDAGTSEDARGVCATNGRLYTFETVNNGAMTHTLWTSTCSQSKGTMGADVAKIRALFVNQIPDFDPNYITTAQTTNSLTFF